eukprot:TRINITY_DN7045_c0_g1_i1.p2 TRINITY_DN7045_c0_g1~~TRINITY_DN7045_c0_g1_i1.p2  ORF type:complete len:287 (-),score=74.40 TRINITY_DN7045_c0_g1_i1:1841-2701(-)
MFRSVIGRGGMSRHHAARRRLAKTVNLQHFLFAHPRCMASMSVPILKKRTGGSGGDGGGGGASGGVSGQKRSQELDMLLSSISGDSPLKSPVKAPGSAPSPSASSSTSSSSSTGNSSDSSEPTTASSLKQQVKDQIQQEGKTSFRGVFFPVLIGSTLLFWIFQLRAENFGLREALGEDLTERKKTRGEQVMKREEDLSLTDVLKKERIEHREREKESRETLRLAVMAESAALAKKHGIRDEKSFGVDVDEVLARAIRQENEKDDARADNMAPFILKKTTIWNHQMW